MKFWVVVDYYEGVDLIGIYPTKTEAIKVKSNFIEETDGECEIEIYEKEYTVKDVERLKKRGFIK